MDALDLTLLRGQVATLMAERDALRREVEAARKMMNTVTSSELSSYALDYFNEEEYDEWCSIRAANEAREAARKRDAT